MGRRGSIGCRSIAKVPEESSAPVDVFEKTKLFPLKHWLLLFMLNDETGCALTSKVFVVLSLQP